MSAASKVEQALKDERKKAIKEGHKPYFLKDGELDLMLLKLSLSPLNTIRLQLVV